MVAVLAVMVTLLIAPAKNESQTSDEAAYVVSGLSYWRTHDFRLNIEHPPLLKEIFALPLLARHAKFFANDSDWNGASEWDVAPKVLYGNVVSGMTLLRDARFVNIGLTALLVLLLVGWSYRMWGVRGAGITLVLGAFEPNILANGHLATTDIGYTLGMLVSIVAFGWYLERPTMRRLIFTALAFSFALLTRFNAALLVLILPVEYEVVMWANSDRAALSCRQAWKTVGEFALVAFVTIWASYGFEVRTLNQFQDQQALHTLGHLGVVGRFLTTTPLPAASYVSGALWQASHNAGGQPAYLFGHTSDNGWWYYFPAAMAVKMTLAALALALIAVVARIKKRAYVVRPSTAFSGLFLLVPMVLLLAIGMVTKLDIGVRYVLPVVAMLTVAAGGAARLVPSRLNWYGGVIGLLLVWNVVSVVRVYPHFLPYANEAFGGPSNLYKSLIDSNLDWGQDTPLLTKYLADHDITDYRVHLFSNAPGWVYRIDGGDVPTDQDRANEPYFGVVAIGVSQLYYPAYHYEWLKSVTPTAVLGHSINVYDFRPVSR